MNELEPRESALAKRKEEINLFLGKSVEKLRAGGGPGYDLVTEFRKTKKNFSPIVPISIAAVILVFIGASWFITNAIDKQARSVSVDIQAFEDLNLKDLLDQAKATMNDLNAALAELSALENEMAAEIARVRDEKAAATALANALGPEEANRRKAAIDSDAAEKERSVRVDFERRLSDKRRTVKSLQERAAAYDARSVEEARKQQETLDNQQRLFNIEKDKLTSSYEKRLSAADAKLKTEKADGAARLKQTIEQLTARYERELSQMTSRYEKELADTTAKYNPEWTDERGRAFASADPKAPRPAAVRAPDRAPVGSPVGIEELRRTAGHYDDLRFIIGRLRSVPYINSVPGALSAADSSAAALAGSYARLVGEASEETRQRDERITRLEETLARARGRIDNYLFAFSGLARDENEAGFVLDSRNPERVVLYIDPFFQVANGTSAWAFRAVDKPIAELTLRRDGDMFVARVQRAEAGFSLQPFDRILLKLSETDITGEAQ